ncbi:sperm flagellar protein 1 isoform X2 [Scyliorhinus torazame]|uniref:sperm flagellar protein 1 isoform X2 n=1 Tax=Scyliorhinus torazame TaxID=75743 RepID=UPI003B5A0E89
MARQLSKEAMQELYAWIDKIPLSRPKRNIARDFSDGVLVAEVVKHFLPKLVDIHNYFPANSTQQKLSNWQILNRKVFSKLRYHIPEDMLTKLIKSSPGIIETVLCMLRQKIEEELNSVQMEHYSTGADKSFLDYAPPNMHQSQVEMWYNSQNQRSFCEQYSHLDPEIRLLLEEKEQALFALRETVGLQFEQKGNVTTNIQRCGAALKSKRPASSDTPHQRYLPVPPTATPPPPTYYRRGFPGGRGWEPCKTPWSVAGPPDPAADRWRAISTAGKHAGARGWKFPPNFYRMAPSWRFPYFPFLLFFAVTILIHGCFMDLYL